MLPIPIDNILIDKGLSCATRRFGPPLPGNAFLMGACGYLDHTIFELFIKYQRRACLDEIAKWAGVEHFLMPPIGAPVILRKVDAAAVSEAVEGGVGIAQQQLNYRLGASIAANAQETRGLKYRVVDRCGELMINIFQR